MSNDCKSQLQTTDYRLRGRFWVETRQGTFLGTGRVILLERIREHGSISAAARSMKMSYRQAWQLVQSMNAHSPEPLVASATGGKGGGGASLTEAGDRAIDLFWTLQADLDAYLQQRAQQISL